MQFTINITCQQYAIYATCALIVSLVLLWLESRDPLVVIPIVWPLGSLILFYIVYCIVLAPITGRATKVTLTLAALLSLATAVAAAYWYFNP